MLNFISVFVLLVHFKRHLCRLTTVTNHHRTLAFSLLACTQQEAQLSPTDRAMRLVSSNLASYHATVQKLLIRQVLTKLMA